MARFIFDVARRIEQPLSLVIATVQVAFIECVFQIDHGTTKLLSVGIQMVLMTSSIFAAAIKFAIKVAIEVFAQPVKSSD